jgi:hypothetical protein
MVTVSNVGGINSGPNSSNVTSLQSALRDVGGTSTAQATLLAGVNSNFILPGFKPNINDHFGLIGNASTSTLGGILFSIQIPNNTDLYLINVGAYTINIAHQDAGSALGNQFICSGANYAVLPPYAAVRCKYLVNLIAGVNYWCLS